MKTIVKAILQYILFWLMYFLGRYLFKIRNKVEIIGKENLPNKARILYLSNHQALIDSLLIGVNVVTIKELFFRQRHIPWNAPDRKNFLSHGFLKYLFRLLKNIPVDRGQKTLEDIKNQIKSYVKTLIKDNLLIFFEGTRTRDGSIGRCKRAIAEAILEAKPDYIIPITLVGISDIMPVEVGFKWHKIGSGHKGKMIIGQPLDFSEIISSEILTEDKKISLIRQKIKEAVEANYK